jgi:hypothetical protein
MSLLHSEAGTSRGRNSSGSEGHWNQGPTFTVTMKAIWYLQVVRKACDVQEFMQLVTGCYEGSDADKLSGKLMFHST